MWHCKIFQWNRLASPFQVPPGPPGGSGWTDIKQLDWQFHFMLTCIRAGTHGECVIWDRIPSVSSHYWFMRRGFPRTRSPRREESPAERLIIFLPLYTPRQHLRANIWLAISFYISRGFVGRKGGAAAVAGELWGKLSRNIQTLTGRGSAAC